MAEVSDYYLTLSIPETASAAEIKRAYRSLAHALHPDRTEGDVRRLEHFRAVQEAYEVLSNPSERLRYDEMLRGSGMTTRYTSGIDRSHSRPHVRSEVLISFETSLSGGLVDVRLPDQTVQQVTIPKGIRSGLELCFKGLGPETENEDRGDLYVVFRVTPSPRFRREGNDLHIIEPITVVDALLGVRRNIANAYGRNVKVLIPPGTQPNERLRLRGQGVQTATQCGDLYVEVQVVVPRSLTDRQRDTLAACVRDLGIQ